jgi:hypothetical protein
MDEMDSFKEARVPGVPLHPVIALVPGVRLGPGVALRPGTIFSPQHTLFQV